VQVYRIPFTETEEEKLFYNFSLREATTIGLGFFICLMVGLPIFALTRNVLIAIIPAVAITPLSLWTAKGKVRVVKDDKESRLTVNEYFMRRLSCRKPKQWTMYTRSEE